MDRSRSQVLTSLGVAALWTAIALGALVAGVDYYRTPMADRPYSDLHDLYGPAGIVGHAYGITGTLMMLVGVAGYSARKRMKGLDGVGKLRTWLRVHIFLCTLGPALVLLHTSFRFGGLVSIAFWSMTAVVASGVFGRYLYVRLPRGGAGAPVPPVALRRARVELGDRVAAAVPVAARDLEHLFGKDPGDSSPGLASALAGAVRFDLERRRLPSRLRSDMHLMGLSPGAINDLLPDVLSYREMRHRMLTFDPFRRLFGYWHVFHLPLAVVMLLIVLLHVAVAAALGYVWILS